MEFALIIIGALFVVGFVISLAILLVFEKFNLLLLPFVSLALGTFLCCAGSYINNYKSTPEYHQFEIRMAEENLNKLKEIDLK